MTLAGKHFGLRRQVKRDAALETRQRLELFRQKRCRRSALPAQSKSCRWMPRHFLPSVDFENTQQH